MILKKKTNRREFMVGCSAAIAAMAGSKLTLTAFASPDEEPNQEILVVVFLRGGCDGLNFVTPMAGTDRAFYEAERQDLTIPAGELDSLGTMMGHNGADDVELGLHPEAAPMYDLFQNGNLAVVHAAGLDYGSRSHFDMMEYIERGTPGDKSTASGWLTRHLQSSPSLPNEIIAPALAIGNSQPTSLLASREVIATSSLSNFTLNTGASSWRNAQRVAMRNLYSAEDSWLHQSGIQAMNAMDIIENQDLSYTPANGANYPSGSFGDHLESVAQIIKLQLGLRVATIDLGGWDTHEYQGNDSGGNFGQNLVGRLAEGLNAFYTDLSGSGTLNYNSRVTTVVITEFGRKLIMNASYGTDHGHGSIMFVMGGEVNGGLYGKWPGLSNDQLYDGRDLAITTDYRQVLSEILVKRLGNPYLGIVFPGYTGYDPLGIVRGGTGVFPIYDEQPHQVFLPTVVK